MLLTNSKLQQCTTITKSSSNLNLSNCKMFIQPIFYHTKVFMLNPMQVHKLLSVCFSQLLSEILSADKIQAKPTFHS